ncbi:MAG: hypothetical protein HeimC2_43930 [Candidatus Heimdallarchaeota archaeon LC_2]|nr:MAG: hypothetical protein HeimC2_43930 [Candidatus Heimdallarchaeota archaeon LC_2]
MLLKLSGVVVFLNILSVSKLEFSMIWLVYATVFLILFLRSPEFKQINGEEDPEELSKDAMNLFVYGIYQSLFFMYLVFDAYIWINI